MSWSLKEAVKKYSTDPKEREKVEQYIATIGDDKPEKLAYWQAIQRNDVTTVDRMLTRKDIERTRQRLKSSPSASEEEYLNHLEKHLEKLESTKG